MADALGVSQPTIWRWLNQSKQMPAEHVLTAERLTGVSCHDLRPDIYPREMMVDARIGQRFQAAFGGPRHFIPPAAGDNAAPTRVIFNRRVQTKAAAG